MTRKKAVPHGGAEAVLDAFGIDALCDRLVAGETQTKICKQLKIAMGSLGRWIALDDQRAMRVREARIEAARAYEEKATEAILGARNPFGLAKAKELAHHYRWKAAKADPRGYGEKLEIDQRTRITDLTDEQLDAKLAQLAAATADPS